MVSSTKVTVSVSENCLYTLVEKGKRRKWQGRMREKHFPFINHYYSSFPSPRGRGINNLRLVSDPETFSVK